jgi:hypothetical protein
MPEFVRGEWIWKKSLLSKTDCFLFARKEFNLDFGGVESDFWISAHCAYQLFINDRFVGYGPRANNNPEASYVDQYNISYYLQQGTNVVAVLLYYTAPQFGKRETKVPGLWCQLNLDQEPLLWSDRNWDIKEGNCFDYPRARIASKLGMTEYVNLKNYPAEWNSASGTYKEGWEKPDTTVAITDPGGKLEISPLAPNSVEEGIFFEPLKKGTLSPDSAFTHVNFSSIFQGLEGVYAATAFMFSEHNTTLKAEVHSDDPYKMFCNNRLVKTDLQCGTIDAGNAAADIPVRQGWNRILIIQQAAKNSMGVMMVFPELKQEELRLFQDTIQDSPLCWNIAGPLKLPLQEATPSLQFERLDSKSFTAVIENTIDIDSFLKNCKFEEKEDNPIPEFGTGEYLIFKLDSLKYGFPVIELNASEDDVVDITFGNRLDSKGFPAYGPGIRGTHTLICAKGDNKFRKFKPLECCYMMISARKITGKINVINAEFRELVRAQRNETLFRCSDDQLNMIWNVGTRTLKRAAAYLYQDEPRAAYACYLGDSYILSSNMIAAFGDYFMSQVRLRQFANAQFENGDIPALTFGKALCSQINHMFLFPVWLNYHYKTSGNEGILHEMLPHLDLAFEFFETLRDDETGLLSDLDEKFKLRCLLNQNEAKRSGVATDLNAMYCRFLLSAAEIYRVANRPETLAKCFRLASDVARALKELNWLPEEHSFAQYSIDSVPKNPDDAFCNFAALYSGVTAANEFENVFFRFFNFHEPFAIFPQQTDNPYFSFFFLETLFAMDQADWGLRYLKDYWGKRLNKETMAWKINPQNDNIAITDITPGSNVVPNAFLIREAAGIRVAEPGYSTIYFNPAVKVLKWAEVVIPTSYGKIKIKWELQDDDSLDVTIDTKFPLKVLPEMSPEMIKNTTFRLGENVSLLDPQSAQKP